MARPRHETFDKQKIVAENRRAKFDFALDESFEAGIALTGMRGSAPSCTTTDQLRSAGVSTCSAVRLRIQGAWRRRRRRVAGKACRKGRRNYRT